MSYCFTRRASLIAAALAIASGAALSPALAADQVVALSQPRDARSPLFDDIVITARKRADTEEAQDTPLAVTVFNEEQYQAVFATDLRDLGKLVPNVKLEGSSLVGLPNFTIRGMGVVGSVPSDAPAVGILQNGVFWGSNFGSLLDTFDIESIEILRGPQGTLFGRNVTGGAVLVRTKRPGDDFGFELEGTIGSHGRNDVALAVEGPASSVGAARIVGLYRSNHGYFTNLLSDEHFGGSETNVVRGTFVLRPAPTFDLTLIADHYVQDGDSMPVVGIEAPGSIPYINGFRQPEDYWDLLLDRPGFSRIKVDSAMLEANWDVGQGVITSVTGGRRVFNFADTDFDGTGYPAVNQAVRFSAEQVSQELRYASRFSSRVAFTVGAYFFDLEHQFREGRTLFNDASIFASGNWVHQRSKAVFGEADVRLPHNVTVTAGGRYTDESISARSRAFGGCPLPAAGRNRHRVLTLPCDLGPKDTARFDHFSPKLGVSWQPDDDNLVYGTVSGGFRSGGFSLRGSALTPPFDEERVTAFEIGYKGDLLDHRLRLNLALFRNDYEDLQRTIIFYSPQYGSIQKTGNAASAKIQGAEAELAFQPFDRFVLTGSYGYTDADFRSFVGLDLTGDGVPDPELAKDLEFTRVAKHDGSVTASYSLPLTSRLTADLRLAATLQSGHFLDDLNRVWEPGYAMFDASLILRSADDGWTAALFVKNIGDQKYAYFGANAGVIGRLEYASPPRTFGVTLRYDY